MSLAKQRRGGVVNRAAQKLGRLGKGKPKNYSAAEIALRAGRMRAYNVRRAAAKALKAGNATA